MAISSYISTKALNEGNRLTVLKLQQRLLVAQKEVSSGRHADVGQTLGARTTDSVSLRQELSRLQNIVDTNSSVSASLDVSQEALNSTAKTAQDLISTLIASRDTATGPQIVQREAKASLNALTDTLNTSFAGGFLFGGINTDVKPVTSYEATPTPANKQAVADAFLAEFGFTQSDPAVANITPAQMENFLDTTFADLFEEPAWSTNWSDASSQNVESRISVSEKIETSTNANDVAFRKLAKVYTMLSDLGVENMSKETFSTVVGKGLVLAGEAVQDVAVLQATLGTSEGRIASANTKMSAQVDILTNQINGLEAVDPFDATVRVNSLLTQLQTAYSLTAQVQQLTILNYL